MCSRAVRRRFHMETIKASTGRSCNVDAMSRTKTARNSRYRVSRAVILPPGFYGCRGTAAISRLLHGEPGIEPPARAIVLRQGLFQQHRAHHLHRHAPTLQDAVMELFRGHLAAL